MLNFPQKYITTDVSTLIAAALQKRITVEGRATSNERTRVRNTRDYHVLTFSFLFFFFSLRFKYRVLSLQLLIFPSNSFHCTCIWIPSLFQLELNSTKLASPAPWEPRCAATICMYIRRSYHTHLLTPEIPCTFLGTIQTCVPPKIGPTSHPR